MRCGAHNLLFATAATQMHACICNTSYFYYLQVHCAQPAGVGLSLQLEQVAVAPTAVAPLQQLLHQRSQQHRCRRCVCSSCRCQSGGLVNQGQQGAVVDPVSTLRPAC